MREWRRFAPSIFLLGFLFSLAALPARAQWAPRNPITNVQQLTDGVLFTMQVGMLKLQVCTDSIIRVRYSATSAFSDRPDYVVTKTSWPETKWAMQSTDDEVTLTTPRLAITVTRKDGAITYRDLEGKQLLQEATRKLTPVKVNGEDTYRAESFINIYGSARSSLRTGPAPGRRVELSRRIRGSLPGKHQHRHSTSSFDQRLRIFWNNDSRSRFNNRFCNTCISVRKSPITSTTTSSTAPISTRSLPTTAN